MMKLAIGLALLILAALLAAVGWVLARPRWRWERPELDVAELGLSAEQTAILRDHLASRQQTVAEFFGDVLMEYGLGQATGKRYPPPAAIDWTNVRYSTGSPYSVTSRADNGTGYDPRLMGA